jgi:hypothetical protein
MRTWEGLSSWSPIASSQAHLTLEFFYGLPEKKLQLVGMSILINHIKPWVGMLQEMSAAPRGSAGGGPKAATLAARHPATRLSAPITVEPDTDILSGLPVSKARKVVAPTTMHYWLQPVRRRPQDAEPPRKPTHHHGHMPTRRRSQWRLAATRGEHRLGRCALKTTRGQWPQRFMRQGEPRHRRRQQHEHSESYSAC